MTVLPTKQQRLALNVTTLSRAIVFSGLVLKSVLVGNPATAAVPASGSNPPVPAVKAVPMDRLNKNVRITPGIYIPKSGEPIPVVVLNFVFQYTHNTALRKGGNFLDSIKPLSAGTAQTFNHTPTSTTATLTDNFADGGTLEQYLVWCIKQLKAEIETITPKPYWVCSCIVKDDLPEGELHLQVQLPIDEAIYASTGSLIDAVLPLSSLVDAVDSGTNGGSGGSGATTITIDPLDNDHFLTNTTYFGN